MKNTINPDKISTFPQCMHVIIDDYFTELQKAFGHLQFSESYEYAVHISPSGEYYNLIKSIMDEIAIALANYRLVCFHATRLLDVESFMLEGLKISDEIGRVNRLCSIADALVFNTDEKNYMLEKCQYYWDRDLNRRNSIHFYFCHDYKKYKMFTKNLGGEIVAFALDKKLDEAPYDKLKTVVTPVYISFLCDFDSIDESICQGTIALELAKSLIVPKLFELEYTPEFDGWIGSNVPPADILSIFYK